VSVLFPFHTTHADYTDEQAHVYHDQSECSEAKKIQCMHRTDGSGGRPLSPECARIGGAPLPRFQSAR